MFEALQRWHAPKYWLEISTLDMHTAGEPLRIITGGLPELPGDTVLARRQFMRQHHDDLRRALMWEPRGHREMYGCVLVPPEHAGSHFGVFFLHNEGYSTMCGHAVIALARVAEEVGLVPWEAPETEVVMDTPAGTVHARVATEGETPGAVSFRNVPSFAVALDETVSVPGYGEVRYDLAYGGAYYAYVEAAALDLTCSPDNHRALIDAGRNIKAAIQATRPIHHPGEAELGFLYGIIFIGPAGQPGHHSRQVCVFADGQVDRSPTGTGVSGRVALAHARGEIKPGEEWVIESIIGTTFTVRIAETTRVGPYEAVVPVVGGRAYLTGRHTFWIDPEDPLGNGFFIG